MTSVATNAALPATPAPANPASARPLASASFGHARALACRECGASFDLGGQHACSECFGPLEVSYDLPPVTRQEIESGPPNIWRYASLLPVPPDIARRPNTEPGRTRLVRADALARKLGMRRLWVKDERSNPTHSFKDRVDSVVLIPANLEPEKILASAVYGGLLVKVDGGYDEVNRLASELAEEREDWAFVNVNVRPYYAEGSKTIGYEIAEDLGWRLPRQIVVPVASGAQLVKIDKAFREFVALGLVPESDVTVYGAQASGCALVAAAYAAGHDVVQPVRPDTIAKSLAIGNPADGPYVLDVVRRTGGTVADAPDPEIVDSIMLLAATEGIFGETAAGVTIAVLRRLLATGKLDPAEETVIINSGDGLKTLNAIV